MNGPKTKGFSTVLNTLYDISQSEDFRLFANKVRLKYSLPLEGIALPKGETLYNVAVYFDFKGYVHSTKSLEEKENINRGIYRDLKSYGTKVGIHQWGFIELLIPFIHVRYISRKDFKKLAEFHDSNLDVCHVSRMDFLVNEVKRFVIDNKVEDKPIPVQDEKELLDDDIANFPAILLISRSASINQIVDYVRKNKSAIKRAQLSRNEDPVPIMKARAKLMTEKYDYIWTNRNIHPRNKLAMLVNRKFNTKHDAIYIRNILSRENKKRVS